MQKVEFEGRTYKLPDCDKYDNEFLIASLYSVNTRQFEAGPNLTEIQRFVLIRLYQDIITKTLNSLSDENGEYHHSAPNKARKAANVELRKRTNSIKAMNGGQSISLYDYTKLLIDL